MLRVVVHHQAAHAAVFDPIERIGQHRHRIAIECVGLAVKFDQRDAVEIEPARDRAAVLRLQGLAQLTEARDPDGTLNRLPGAAGMA